MASEEDDDPTHAVRDQHSADKNTHWMQWMDSLAAAAAALPMKGY